MRIGLSLVLLLVLCGCSPPWQGPPDFDSIFVADRVVEWKISVSDENWLKLMVRPEEYEERFPDQCEALRQLMQLDTPAVTSALLSSAPPTDLKPGDQLDDFDLLAQLGKGAFATVFLARQRSLQRRQCDDGLL